MAKSREILHEVLCNTLGSRNVYFQPPESIKLKYPAIVYSKKNFMNNYAENRIYKESVVYDIVVIDTDPESEVVDKLLKLPLCNFDRCYTADNLYHNALTIYY
jgi:hypothetical protein